MRWLERATAAASYCCWCRCLQRDKASGLAMPRGSRADVASPVMIHYDLSGTPLFDENDESMDVVLYDTTVEYVPNKTRIRTALSCDASIENLRKQLLDPNDQQIFALGNLAAELANCEEEEEEEEDEEEDDEEETATYKRTNHRPGSSSSPYCYEKTVEMESPNMNQSRVSLGSNESRIDRQQQQGSAVVSMFRALRCFEGDDFPDVGSHDHLPRSLEIRRPKRQKHAQGRHNSKGYSQVPRNATIEY